MSLSVDDTIAALATAPGGAARGIVRLSGPQVRGCLQRVFRADSGWDRGRLPSVLRGHLDLGTRLGWVPCRLYWWPGPRSYTRQPTAELHLPGSPPLLEAALRELCASGARLAGPGEFTMRAFLAGRIDLTQAEAVLGVIDARSDQELEVALTQLSGGLASPLGRLRDELLDLLADLEAGLDFVEDDIEFISPEQLATRLAAVAAELEALHERMQSRSLSDHLPRVVLRGIPNAGKSSLLNALADDDAALVSPQAGTTRDYLWRDVELGAGVTCRLIDTAGLNAGSGDELDDSAQRMANQQAHAGHLELLCIEAGRELSELELAELRGGGDRRLVVATKCDQGPPAAALQGAVQTSSVRREGLDCLRTRIRERLQQSSTAEVVAETAARCRDSVQQARDAVREAQSLAMQATGEELVAAELRLALEELGRVVGQIYTDDVLDRIFARFCIGK